MVKIKCIKLCESSSGLDTLTSTNLIFKFDNDRHYAADIRSESSPQQVLALLEQLTSSIRYDLKNGVFK